MERNYTFCDIGEDKYVVSIANHAEVFETLKQFCVDMDITAGIIHGIGAVSEATLRFFNPITKQYVDKTFTEQMEIANLTGNISTLNGETYLHLHVVLGRADYTALAGHLLSTKICGAGEFVVEEYFETIERKLDEEIGLNVYDLE